MTDIKLLMIKLLDATIFINLHIENNWKDFVKLDIVISKYDSFF